jgi:hypothetical protein
MRQWRLLKSDGAKGCAKETDGKSAEATTKTLSRKNCAFFPEEKNRIAWRRRRVWVIVLCVDADVKSAVVFGKIANIWDLGKAASVPGKNL